jgi:hypothetical protein
MSKFCFDKNRIKINFSAESYISMVEWELVEFDSPPLLQDITSEDIASKSQVILPHFPCHSQDVERNIKDVTAVCGSGVARIFQQGVRSWGHGKSRGTGTSTNKLR